MSVSCRSRATEGNAEQLKAFAHGDLCSELPNLIFAEFRNKAENLSASFLFSAAIIIFFALPAYAQVPSCPSTVNSGNPPLTTCSSPSNIQWQSGNILIAPGAVVEPLSILYETGNVSTLTNYGSLNGTVEGVFGRYVSLKDINNQNSAQITGGNYGIWNTFGASIESINNHGLIQGQQYSGIANLLNSSIAVINNFRDGTISVGVGNISYGAIDNSDSTIGEINNFGRIAGPVGGYDITNYGTSFIGSLINAQGARPSIVGDAPLRFKGNLPSFYQIVIDKNEYGKINFAEPGNSTTSFGIYSGSSLAYLRTRYTTVVSSDPRTLENKIINMNGATASGRKWHLIDNGDGTYDLEVDGYIVVSKVYSSLQSNRDALLGALHERYAVLNTVSQYDCNRFDKYGVCLSFQARATGWGSQTTGAGVFNIAYRVHPNIRAGVYLDYQVAQATPFGTNFGTGGIQYGYNNPTFGGYVGFSQSGYNGTPVNEGVQAFMSGGYNPGKITVTRAILDGTEPGQGTAGLNAYYAYGTLGYGVKIADKTTIAPYAGLFYTNVIRNAYQEQLNPLVQSLLGYNAFYEQLLTGVVGGRVQSMITDKLGANIGAGAQFDLTRNANSYSGYSYIEGMEAFGIEHGGSWNGARPTGQAGVFYNVTRNEQLLLNAYVGQQAYTTRTYTSLLAGYQLSF